MRTKNVVVLESNVTLQQELKEAMESSEELRVVYAGDDGEAGIKQIQQQKPEMAIVGMFLKGTDGCGVIRAIRKQGGTPKIIATGVSNDALMEKALFTTITNVNFNDTMIREIISEVLYPILDRFDFPKDVEILINPSGRFVEGGPAADTGLTGRKLMVDTYGGLAAHGGGAFSGKDPTKVDRSAAYMARAIARNVVGA